MAYYIVVYTQIGSVQTYIPTNLLIFGRDLLNYLNFIRYIAVF